MDIHALLHDKTRLRWILQKGVGESNVAGDVFEFAMALMTNLHSTDPELRDELSYSILENLIQSDTLLSSQLAELLHFALSEELLFFRIGEHDTDSVFARSFALLIVGTILDADVTTRRLDSQSVHEAIGKVIEYASKERDYRGYVQGKGWAHSIAHAADALGSCVQHPVATESERKRIVVAIRELATVCYPLHHREDDRLSYALLQVVEAERIDTESLVEWIRGFEFDAEASDEFCACNVNAEHFLRSLYFMLLWRVPGHTLLDPISNQIKTFNLFHRYRIL